jgi:hypothetical protein
MHTLYTVLVYLALCLWRGGNESSAGIWTKFALCTVLIVGLFEYERVFYTLFAPFEFLLGYTDPRRPNPNAMHEYVVVSSMGVVNGRPPQPVCCSLTVPPPTTPTPHKKIAGSSSAPGSIGTSGFME